VEVIRAIVLADASLLGADSPGALSQWGQTTLIEHVLDTLARTQVAGVIVVAGMNAWSLRKKLQGHGVNVVAIRRLPSWRLGPLSPVKCGLRALPKGTQAALLISLDQAAVPAVVVDRLLEAVLQPGKPVVVPTYKRQRGWPIAIEIASFGQTLLEARDEQTVEEVIERSGVPVLEIPVETRAVVLSLQDVLRP
jgi:CTP:molybdopterin cytidylyltransferase MocA